MWRTVLAVVAGYLVMAAFIMSTFTGVYFAMGTEGAFQPGRFDVSTKWIVITFGLSMIAALLGGFVCHRVARNDTAPRILAAVVLALGLAMAVPVALESTDTDADAPLKRTGELSNFEAMNQAKQPTWIALTNPVIGLVGVLAGQCLSLNLPGGSRHRTS